MTQYATNDEGFLIDYTDWDEAFTQEQAQRDQLELTEIHWSVLDFFRTFYINFQATPSNRAIIKHLRTAFPDQDISSARLALMFPGGLMKQGSRLAGLPKPARCT